MKNKSSRVDVFFGRDQKNKQKKTLLSKNNVNNTLGGTKIKDKDLPSVKRKENNNGLVNINGIGPVMARILSENGINDIVQLANTSVESLSEVVNNVRGNHDPRAWVRQAKQMITEVNKRESFATLAISKRSKAQNAKDKIVQRGDKSRINSQKIVKKQRLKKTQVKINNESSKLITASNFILVSLFFGIGLFFTKQTLQGINFEKSVVFYLSIAIALVLVLVRFLLKRSIKIRKTPFDVIFGLFILLYGVSAWLSVDRWHSFMGFFNDPTRGFIFVVTMILTFYLILSNFTIKTAKNSFKAFVAFIVIISLYTLISGLGFIPKNFQVLIPFSLVGSLKGLAILLSGGIPLLAISYLLLNKWSHRKLALICQGIILVSFGATIMDLLMLRVFVPWVSLLIGVTILIFLLVNKNGKKIGGNIGRGVVFTILATIVLLSGWAKSDYRVLMPSIARVGLPVEIKATLPVSYKIVKNSLTDNWKQIAFGSGPATFGYDFAKFSPANVASPMSNIEYLYQGEGLLVESVTTIGIAGALLIILGSIIFIRKSLEVLNIENEARAYFIGLFTASIVLLINGATNQINGGILITGSLIFGLTIFLMLKISDQKEYYNVNLNGVSFANFMKAVVVVILFVILLGGSISVGKSYLADTYLATALAQQDDDRNKNKIIEAIRIRPNEGVYYTKLGQVLLSVVNKKIQAEEKIDKSEIDTLRQEVLYYVERGARLMPNDVKTQRFLATTYEITDSNNVERLKDIYGHIIKLDPNKIQYYVKMGDLYLFQASQDNKDDDLDKALKWYVKALSFQAQSGFIYDRIATVFYRKKDFDKAIVNIAKAVKASPNNISYKFTLGVLYQLKGEKNDVAIAEKIFKTLLTISPQNIDVLAQLGLLYEQTGHLDEAKKQYSHIITIIGDKEELKKAKEVFKEFISNLDEGKLNIKHKTESIDNVTDVSALESDKNESDNADNEDQVETESDTITNNVDELQNIDEKITVTVGDEGPINVRSEGALTGDKLTKIKETQKFKKLGENEKWVQILIPGIDGQEDIKGWVHKKFVTE